jgi:chromosome segregation ATPase
MKRKIVKENKMSDNYCISVGLDYRYDGEDHEVEINYWDSDDNEACGKATSDSFDKSATSAFENLVVDLASQKKEDEVDYKSDLQEYIADLEEYVADLENESDALLEENDRLEHRIQDLQKQIAILQKNQNDLRGQMIVPNALKSKYDNSVTYGTSTSTKKEAKNEVDDLVNLLRSLKLF